MADVPMLKKTLLNLWDKVPQEVKDDYGQEFFDLCEFLQLFQ